MKQKRKVRNLLSKKTMGDINFFSCLLIVLGCLFCVGSVSLLVTSAEDLDSEYGGGSVNMLYTGVNDNMEVIYHVSFIDSDREQQEELYMDDGGFYITSNPVVVNGIYADEFYKTNVVSDVYGNILGGDSNIINSDNVTLVAGKNNVINEGNQDVTVLGGNGNNVDSRSSGKPSVVIGGSGNQFGNGQSNNVIIGGDNNKIDNNVINSAILGGSDNVVIGKNAIVGGSRVKIRGGSLVDHVFVFSDGNESEFNPSSKDTFYLSVNGGLGINTWSRSKGVSVKGGISIGEINIDSDICSDGDYGVQGMWEGCLVGCTRISRGNGWELLENSDRCVDLCMNNDKCLTTEASQSLNPGDRSFLSICTQGEFYTGNAIICNSRSLLMHENIAYQTTLLEYGVPCPISQNENDNYDNKCVFKCNSGTHLTGDLTGRFGLTGCYRDCKLPWSLSGEVIRHNEIVMGYNLADAHCSNSGEHDTCTNHEKALVCSDGDLYIVDEGNVASSDLAKSLGYLSDACTLNGFSCNLGYYNVAYNEVNMDTGNYESCMDYGVVGGECVGSDENYHYRLLSCKSGYSTGAGYPNECR